MELKPGYKQTEVGVIPEEWEVVPFVSLGSVIDGDRGTNYPGSKEFTVDGHCLFLNAGNVTKAGFRFSDCAFISREKDEQLSKGKLKRDDIILTTRGTVGNFAHFDSTVSFEHIRINSGMVILRNESAELDTAFLYALLQSHCVETQIERLTFGSAQPQLTVKGINEFWIVAPPLPEQRAIAAALSDVDGLLGGLDRLIAKKRDLKQAAMQQLLTGQTRLPGFDGEWEVKTVSDVCWFQEGPGVRNTQFTSSGVKLLNGTNIFRGRINLDTTDRFISEKEAHGVYAHFLADHGDIAIACSGISVEKFHEKVAVVTHAQLPFCMNTSTMRFKTRQEHLVRDYFCHFLMGDSFKRQIAPQATGSAQLNFGPSHVEKVELPLPPLSEQTAIAEVLTEMDAELAALAQQREKTRALKQAMMQELLTGRTRLQGSLADLGNGHATAQESHA